MKSSDTVEQLIAKATYRVFRDKTLTWDELDKLHHETANQIYQLIEKEVIGAEINPVKKMSGREHGLCLMLKEEQTAKLKRLFSKDLGGAE